MPRALRRRERPCSRQLHRRRVGRDAQRELAARAHDDAVARERDVAHLRDRERERLRRRCRRASCAETVEQVAARRARHAAAVPSLPVPDELAAQLLAARELDAAAAHGRIACAGSFSV